MTAYTIKPLEWRLGETVPEWWTAETILCHFAVFRIGDRWKWKAIGLPQSFTEPCESFDDGKAKAEAYYRERLLPALVPVPESADAPWKCGMCGYLNGGLVCTHCGDVPVHYPNPEGRT